jgi:hypothetical protein
MPSLKEQIMYNIFHAIANYLSKNGSPQPPPAPLLIKEGEYPGVYPPLLV